MTIGDYICFGKINDFYSSLWYHFDHNEITIKGRKGPKISKR